MKILLFRPHTYVFTLICFALFAANTYAQSNECDMHIVPTPSCSPQNLALLSQAAQNRVNQTTAFSGPNCYHAALLAAGRFIEGENRYVSPEEFELYLQYFFTPTLAPQPKDIVVYEAHDQRGHAAFLLNDNLVFHKKSFSKKYFYRITNIDQVAAIEPGEWIPSRSSGEKPALDGMSTTDKMYYRLQADKPFAIPTPIFSAGAEILAKHQFIELVDLLVLQLSPVWQVGHRLGVVTETLLEDLTNDWRDLAKHPDLGVRFSYAKLISLRDQVINSIGESHFSSPYADARRAKILQEICWNDTPEFRKVIQFLLKVYGKPDTQVDAILQKLKDTDRAECNAHILKLI